MNALANPTPKKLTKRDERLVPNGIPRWIRCYDNGGPSAENGSADRYTVVFTGCYTRKTNRWTQYVGMSAHPFHPQGIGQHGENEFTPIDALGGKWPPAMGRKCHLGKRIPFEELPIDCKIVTLNDYCEIWDLDRAKFSPHNSDSTVSVLSS